MIRLIFVLLLAVVLQGCVSYTLRDITSDATTKEHATERLALRVCPTEFVLQARGSSYTNSFGEREFHPDAVLWLERTFSALTEGVLHEHTCSGERQATAAGSGTLHIEVIQYTHLSALPQEWLTGLSFGLIPSWGTRPEQWKFVFAMNDVQKVFAVDKTTFAHIAVLPFVWLSEDVETSYKKALVTFMNGGGS